MFIEHPPGLIIFGRDSDEYLLLTADCGYLGGNFIKEFHKIYNPGFKDLILYGNTDYSSGTIIPKDDDYDLFDAINAFKSHTIKNHYIFNRKLVEDAFPIYIVKNNFWYIIRDDNIILEPYHPIGEI